MHSPRAAWHLETHSASVTLRLGITPLFLCFTENAGGVSPGNQPLPRAWAALRSWGNLFMGWEKASALPCPCPLAVQLLSCPDCPEQFFLFPQHPVSSGQLSLFAGCLGRKLLPSFKATPCCFPGSCLSPGSRVVSF